MRILITGASGFIGTNLLEACRRAGCDVRNLDCVPPRNSEHASSWVRADLLDRASLGAALRGFSPDRVIHLAARTDLQGRTLDDYRVNTVGLQNLLATLAATSPPERLIAASSMLVCRLGYLPRHDADYCPNTPYGRSKQQGEEALRAAELHFPWIVVRPTSIWGPWFGPPYRNFFEAVQRGRYLHPRGLRGLRTYGYVGNTVQQLWALIEADLGVVAGRTYYLGDDPLDVGDWADRIARAFGRGAVPRAPLFAFQAAAACGELLKRLGWKDVPLTRARLSNLCTPMVAELGPIQSLTGSPAYHLDSGVRDTVEWMRSGSWRGLDALCGSC